MRKFGYLILNLFICFNLTAGESLFGISENSIGLVQQHFSAAGMARSYETAATDSLQINYMNPAMWTLHSFTTYSINGGYQSAYGDDGTDDSYFNSAAGFGSGFLVIPVMKRKLILGAGLSPFTSLEQRLRSDADSTDVRELLVRGGLSKAGLHVSYRILPNLGAALGAEYIFGKVNKKTTIENLTVNEYALNFIYDYRIYGFGASASMFYQPVKNLTLGFSFRPAAKLDVRVRPETSSVEVNKGRLTSITVPAQFDSGIEYVFSKRSAAGLDFSYQDWQNGYKLADGSTDPHHTKYFRIGAGYERKQSSKLFTSFTERLDLRAGLYYSSLNQKSLGNNISEYGLTLGFSLPLQRFRSRIDFAGAVGRRGSLDVNQYEETFINFGISINALETWFISYED